MIEPQVHIAYAPRGAGVLCAACWFSQGEHVYGWFTGARGYEHPAHFFMLESYFSTGEPVCHRSADDDVRGQWMTVSIDGEPLVERHGPVPEPLCHELEQVQDRFAREWLFFRDDPAHTHEAAVLRARELPVMGVNLHPKKLNKLHTDAPVWSYTSPGADLNVIGFLSRRWPLDYALA